MTKNAFSLKFCTWVCVFVYMPMFVRTKLYEQYRLLKSGAHNTGAHEHHVVHFICRFLFRAQSTVSEDSWL